MTTSIYLIRNNANGWVYVGATIRSLSKRLAAHLTPFPDTLFFRGRRNQMYKDSLKYGKDAFSIELIEEVHDPSLVRDIEEYWINKFYGDKCYNLNRKSAYTVKQEGEPIQARRYAAKERE